MTDANPSSTVLVAFASRHGATREIAEEIGKAIDAAGVPTAVREIGEVDDVAGYRAVVFGSAVYMGRWMKEARAFADAHREALSTTPLWLFSSGPIGTPPEPKDSPFGIEDLANELKARGHHVFAGKIDKSELGFGEKAVLRMVGAGEGDFRDWEDIDDWATAVATELTDAAA